MRRAILLGLLCAGCAEVELVEPPRPPRLVGPVPAIGRALDLEVQGRGTPVRLRGVTGRVTAVCVFGADAPAAAQRPASGRSVQLAPDAVEPALGRKGVEATPASTQAPAPEAAAGAAPAPAVAGEASAQGGRPGSDLQREGPAGDALAQAGDPPQEVPGVEAPGFAPEDAAPPDAEGQGDGPPPGSSEPIPRPPADRPAPALGAQAEQVLEACAGLARHLGDRIAIVGLTTDPDLDLGRMVLRTYRDPGGMALAESLELDGAARILLVDVQGRVAEILGAHQLHRAEAAASRLVH